MRVPLLDLKAQYATIRDDVRNALDEVFENQKFVLGPNVEALEREIAGLCGLPYAIGVASGTDALLLSLRALGVGPTSSVVTVPYTFFATAGAIANLGARPLFVDINPEDFCMDPGQLALLLRNECTYNHSSQQLIHKTSGSRVRAVLPVHLYGQCADMDEITSLARRYSIPVIEDSCQALGARYKGRFAGSLGDCGCISFFPSKNLGGAGDGGMVVTSDRDLAERIRLLRTHGGEKKYYHSIVGYNSRLDEVQAAVLRAKLRHLQKWNGDRAGNAMAYEADFKSAGLAPFVKTPAVLPGRDHIFHQYVIRVPRRDELRSHLATQGIGTEVYYPCSLHEQACFRHLGYESSDFPRSRQAAQETLALPVYPELTSEQRLSVVNAIANFYI